MKKIAALIFAFLLSSSLLAGVKSGSAAIDFKLPDLYDEKKSYAMSDFKGEVVLLNIWASWCSGCKAEMPEFFHLQNEYKGKNFKIVTVSVDGNKEKSIKFLQGTEKETGLKNPFVSIWNEDKSLADAYGVRAMPTSYLIDKNGKIVKVIFGSLSKKAIEDLKKEINSLIKE